jgi:Carboxypeptidase regulatory-like domain
VAVVYHRAVEDGLTCIEAQRSLLRNFKMKQLVASLVSIILVTGFGFSDGASASSVQAKFKSGIAGRITDPNGAVIVGATVRIVARSTQDLVSVKTDDKGEYIADLEPEVYDVEAEADGFKKARRKSIPVQSEARSFVDFMLEPKPPNDAEHP